MIEIVAALPYEIGVADSHSHRILEDAETRPINFDCLLEVPLPSTDAPTSPLSRVAMVQISKIVLQKCCLSVDELFRG